MADAEFARDAEAEARRVAEAARETSWAGRSFMRELFLGNLRLDWIHPYPDVETNRPEFLEFFRKLEGFLQREVDPDAIDAAGEYPARVIDGLRSLGAFGMKIEREYGGLGFSQQEYCRALELVGQYDGNLVAQGPKIALVTLNTGRLSLPAAVVGGGKTSLQSARRWAVEREQWGAPIGRHEANAHKVAGMAAKTLAMESVSYLTNALAERKDYDIPTRTASEPNLSALNRGTQVFGTRQRG